MLVGKEPFCVGVEVHLEVVHSFSIAALLSTNVGSHKDAKNIRTQFINS